MSAIRAVFKFVKINPIGEVIWETKTDSANLNRSWSSRQNKGWDRLLDRDAFKRYLEKFPIEF
jgi:hypothetical protein